VGGEVDDDGAVGVAAFEGEVVDADLGGPRPGWLVAMRAAQEGAGAAGVPERAAYPLGHLGAGEQRHRLERRLQPPGHAGEGANDVTEALAEDAASARPVVAMELPCLQADEHALPLRRQVADVALVAGVHTLRYDTAFRARAACRGSRDLDAVPSRKALYADAHQEVFVREQAYEASGVGRHYKYDAV